MHRFNSSSSSSSSSRQLVNAHRYLNLTTYYLTSHRTIVSNIQHEMRHHEDILHIMHILLSISNFIYFVCNNFTTSYTTHLLLLELSFRLAIPAQPNRYYTYNLIIIPWYLLVGRYAKAFARIAIIARSHCIGETT